MGLLMFREPDAVPTITTIKVDSTLSGRIHRRLERHRSSRTQRASPGVDRRIRYERLRRDRDREDAIANSETLDPRPTSVDMFVAGADYARYDRRNRLSSMYGRELLHDALRYERPSQRMRQPSARESTLRYEVTPPPLPPPLPPLHHPANSTDSLLPYEDSPPLSNERQAFRSTYALSGRTGSGRSRRHDGLPRSGPRTHRFAPAYLRYDDPSDTYHIEDRLRATAEGLEFRETLRTSMRNGFNNPHIPPLRRTRRRGGFPFSESDLVPFNTDGLGDRRRSFSPEESTWETLLTTIAPDERLPSAESSFTSATASASASSFSSSATRQTAPSSASEPLNVFSNICDDPTDISCSDTDDDDSPPPVERIRRRRELTAYTVNEDGALDENTENRPAPAVVTDSRFTRVLPRPDIELEQMHSILERMENHEPVPDAWWAAAGLAQNLDRAGLGQVERERL